MATELQKQIGQIRKNIVPTHGAHHGAPSLFLSSKEAAAIDIKEVYNAAIEEGVNVLAQYDSRIEYFLENILHLTSIDIQRELKTKQVSLSFPFAF